MPENQSERNDANENSILIQGKSIEDAIEQGLAQLGLPLEQVDIEIVQEGKRGVFGLGSEEAYVRLTPKASPSPTLETETPSDKVDDVVVEEPAPGEQVGSDSPAGDKAIEAETDSVEAVSVSYLSGLLERMGINAKVTARIAPELVEPDEDPPLVLDVKGKDLGILIGRRSETLQVLQYMIRLMVSKHFNRWEPVVVDVESYRVRRRHSLQKMAQKMAERAVNTDRQVVLEAMPAYERRLVHLALRDHPDVYTKSIGSDDNRKVTIIPK